MGQIKVTKNMGGIEGLCIIEPAVHGDARGYFMETYNQKDMEEGILKHQEGLKSRIGYTYVLKPHTASELASIFSIQLKKGDWLLDLERTQLVELLSKYKKYITNGRDTENLLTKCSDYHTDAVFEDILSGKEIKHIITKDILISSLEHIKKNVPEKEKTLDIYL